MSRIRRKPKKSNEREVTIDFEGKQFTLKFSSDFDHIISAMGVALLALNDPKVNAILKQFGIMFFDKEGNPLREE